MRLLPSGSVIIDSGSGIFRRPSEGPALDVHREELPRRKLVCSIGRCVTPGLRAVRAAVLAPWEDFCHLDMQRLRSEQRQGAEELQGMCEAVQRAEKMEVPLLQCARAERERPRWQGRACRVQL